jgi:protein-L-isoaspartate O-methyltransferase
MERTLSRRALFMKIGKGVGVMAAYDRFGPRLFGTTAATDRQNYLTGLQIFGAYGRMVIPVGASPEAQELLLIVKHADGRIERRSVLPVRFVPLVPGK